MFGKTRFIRQNLRLWDVHLNSSAGETLATSTTSQNEEKTLSKAKEGFVVMKI